MAIIIPLAFLKKLDSMKYTSFLALIAVVYLVIIMIVTAIKPFEGATVPQAWEWGKVTLSGFEKLPIYIFAFTCHQNVLFTISTFVKIRYLRNRNRFLRCSMRCGTIRPKR